jgi:hypothetical protein
VPYSERTTVTEHFDLATLPDGGKLLLVTYHCRRPGVLDRALCRQPAFQEEADGSKWEPTPCSSTW